MRSVHFLNLIVQAKNSVRQFVMRVFSLLDYFEWPESEVLRSMVCRHLTVSESRWFAVR